MYPRNVQNAFDLNAAVAYELDQLRRDTGTTHQTIADRSGLSLITVKRYLGGKRDIPLPAFSAIVLALGGNPLDVFTRAQGRVQANDRRDRNSGHSGND